MRSALAPCHVLLGLLASAWLGAACASHRAGESTTQGALQALRAPPPEGTDTLAQRVGRDTTQAALSELASPEGLSSIASIVDAAVARSLETVLRQDRSVQGRAGPYPGRSLVERMSGDSATAFGAAFSEELLRALGPDGRGPLGASLGATAAQISGSAVQGARGELDGLFPGCEGADRRACLEAGVRSLGRAAATGFVEGIAASSGWVALGLAFLIGVAAVLLAQGGARLLRGRHPERREAHP
jgi:hypothetical protein